MSTNRRILSTTPLLDCKGNVAMPGYATHMYYNYDRKEIKAVGLKLKEWDFYQISDERYVVQIVFGHVSYCSSISATLIDMHTRARYVYTAMKAFPRNKLRMNTNGEQEYLQVYNSKNLVMVLDVTSDSRHLTVDAVADGVEAHFDVELGNVGIDKDKLVIATPFAKQRQFYLNYKENCYTAVANISIGEHSWQIGVNSPAYGLLDWGRGVWPFRHSWVWGNGSTTCQGKYFGFNIGYGFGDNSFASENIFFYDNVGYKLDKVSVDYPTDYVDSNWTVKDNQGKFCFQVQPIFDNYTTTKLLFVDNSCHQVFGLWSGYAILPDGTRLDVEPFVAFCEWAKNRW